MHYTYTKTERVIGFHLLSSTLRLFTTQKQLMNMFHLELQNNALKVEWIGISHSQSF